MRKSSPLKRPANPLPIRQRHKQLRRVPIVRIFENATEKTSQGSRFEEVEFAFFGSRWDAPVKYAFISLLAKTLPTILQANLYKRFIVPPKSIIFAVLNSSSPDSTEY